MTDFIRLVLTVVLAGALIACGGGGGSGSPAAEVIGAWKRCATNWRDIFSAKFGYEGPLR